MTLKELENKVNNVNDSLSNLRDDMATIETEFTNFRTGVTKDLKNILEYLGRQKKSKVTIT